MSGHRQHLYQELGWVESPFTQDIRVGDRLVANDPRRKVKHLVIMAVHGAVTTPNQVMAERVSAVPKPVFLWFVDKQKAIVAVGRIFNDGKKRSHGFNLIRDRELAS